MPHIHPHSTSFLRKLEKYRDSVLRPAGLDFPEPAGPLPSYFPEIAIVPDEDRVWKFYGAGHAHLARNTLKASVRLQAAKVGTPPIVYSDAAPPSVRKHGVACIIMERIVGESFDPGQLMNPATPLAPLFARLHSLTSDRWGALTWRGGHRHPEAYVRWTVAYWLAKLDPLLRASGQAPLAGVREWFERNASCLVPPDGRFHFRHGDIHESNLLVSPDGTIHVLDLDSAGYGAFGLDLAQLINRNHSDAADDLDPGHALDAWESRAAPFLESYFREAGPRRFDQWRAMRKFCFLFFQLRHYLDRAQAATPERCGDFFMTLPEIMEDMRRRRRVLDHFFAGS